MTKTYNIAMIGFGNVGQGFAQILTERAAMLEETYGVAFQVVAVSDLMKGSLYNPDGLPIDGLLTTVQRDGDLNSLSAPHTGWDSVKTIRESNADVIVEISYTDLETGEPALTHIQEALAHDKHIVTTNKGPTALHYPGLLKTAREKNLEIGVEGTVLSGTPALHLGLEVLRGASISKVEGILNGTTNYILTQMEDEMDYADALSEAQEKGYAEADPTGDVDGHDAAGKVVIIANLLLDLPLTMSDVDREGITNITQQDIQAAKAAGERWKLIGTVEKHADGGYTATVKPQRLPAAHPLANIGGATNAITYTTDLLGEVTLVGPGAGRVETGFAILSDLLAIHRKHG